MHKITHNQRLRVYFGKIKSKSTPPPLLKIQMDSYDWFLQKDVDPLNRKNQGWEAVFTSVFPISDFGGTCTLEYVSYRLGEPKFDETECKTRGVTYAAPIRVSLRLIIWEKDEKSDQRRIHDIKEQEIYLGEFPLMTENGSFIVNGTERVIVSQLHKSSGVFFNHDKGKSHASGKLLYSASIIPQRGSWIDFEFDAKDQLYVRIDRRRKFLATTFLKALTFSQKDEKDPEPYTDRDLLDRFYYTETIILEKAFGKDEEKQEFFKYFDPQSSQNQRAVSNIVNLTTNEIIVPKGKKISKSSIRKIQEAEITIIATSIEDIIGRYVLDTIEDKNGEIIIETNGVVTRDVLNKLIENEIKEITFLFIGNKTIGSSFRNTLAADKVKTPEEAVIEIYKKMKPGDPPTLEVAKNMLQSMFFRPERYDLSEVGRMKINKKLDLDIEYDYTILTDDDIFAVVEYLIRLKDGAGGTVDDIDHLGNRRVRGVGELLENQVRIGLVRMERAIRERMSLQETETMMLHDIVNSKPVSAVINEFFGSSQLSQFMDQTNPLAEITHKRRLSALGPGGLTRERAGFEVRDVHTSHYGRICPVETPEGPNIGLISSIATYARLNEYGFIETPYRKVEEKKVTENITFLSAIDEGKYKIAQANAIIGDDGKLAKDVVKARLDGEFKLIRSEEIDFMDVSPKQLVSVAASMIPFLEHDDANRALMGSNMQCQAVPLVNPESPIVGTGMEAEIAGAMGRVIRARHAGVVDFVDA
ncbi:DNA-directed RNA polymerase subunit beta, partial [bacterium]|nr:DNA-directed RNA polymerase subunit beta [bacterium]